MMILTSPPGLVREVRWPETWAQVRVEKLRCQPWRRPVSRWGVKVTKYILIYMPERNTALFTPLQLQLLFIWRSELKQHVTHKCVSTTEWNHWFPALFGLWSLIKKKVYVFDTFQMTERQFPSKLLTWCNLNNCLRPRDVKKITSISVSINHLMTPQVTL